MTIKPTHTAARLAILISASLAAPVMALNAPAASSAAQPGNTSASQQETQAFQRWDANNNGKIDKTEFRNHFTKTHWYANWDTNHDNRISHSEFDAGRQHVAAQANNNNAWDTWDVDGDGFLDDNEFSDGVYNTWDVNHDYGLNDDEYDEGINWFDN